MKRIIAFVLLGLLIYAGGFVIYYSAAELEINSAAPAYLNNIHPGNFRTGLVVEGEIYQAMDKIYEKTTQPRLFGAPFGKAITQHFYVLPLTDSEMYMLIAASDENDIEALEKMIVSAPRERNINDPVLNITGITEEIPFFEKNEMISFLIQHPDLIGYKDQLYARPTEIAASNHIVPYIVYIKHPTGSDYVPLIVGIAMCVVGITLVVLLILRIKSEREGY